MWYPSNFHTKISWKGQYKGFQHYIQDGLSLFFENLFCYVLTKGIPLYTFNRIQKSIKIIGSFLVCGKVCQFVFTSEQDHLFQYEYLCSDSCKRKKKSLCPLYGLYVALHAMII